MSIALVTGCAGFIGSHLVDELLKNNWIVYGIDNFHPYYDRELKELNLKNLKKSKNFTFIEGSILSKSDLNKIPKNIKSSRKLLESIVMQTKNTIIIKLGDF